MWTQASWPNLRYADYESDSKKCVTNSFLLSPNFYLCSKYILLNIICCAVLKDGRYLIEIKFGINFKILYAHVTVAVMRKPPRKIHRQKGMYLESS
jgi:hypothetical protein